jgi:ketosteroid isomerase-like protein
MALNIEKDRVAVTNWVKKMFRSMGDGDFEAFCYNYTDEVRLYPPDTSPLIGIEAMKKLTKPWFEAYKMSHKIIEITAKTDLNTAYAFAQYIDTITPKKGGDPIITPNKAVYVLRREPDNSWKATEVIWNRNPTRKMETQLK